MAPARDHKIYGMNIKLSCYFLNGELCCKPILQNVAGSSQPWDFLLLPSCLLARNLCQQFKNQPFNNKGRKGVRLAYLVVCAAPQTGGQGAIKVRCRFWQTRIFFDRGKPTSLRLNHKEAATTGSDSIGMRFLRWREN